MAQKKRILWIILGIFLLIAVFAYYQYQKIMAVKNLEIELVDISIEDIKLTHLELGLTISIYNPNRIDVGVEAFNASIYANDIPITNIALPPLFIPTDQEIQQKFSIKLGYFEIGTALIRAIEQKNVVWKIQGQYVVELPFGITYPYTFEIIK